MHVRTAAFSAPEYVHSARKVGNVDRSQSRHRPGVQGHPLSKWELHRCPLVHRVMKNAVVITAV